MLKRIIVGAGIAAVGWATYARAQRWRASWGVVPEEVDKPLAGDDLVPAALAVDTRGITIDAPAELIWPWLLQMGYGRGGWYSIDQIDMRGSSATRIVDDWQNLAVGDVVPTHPGGGFAVRVLEPNRALVLFADTDSMRPSDEAAAGTVPIGLAGSGAFMSATPGEFAASWAFVLEPIDANRTRLIERVRYWGVPGSQLSRAALSIFAFGVFVMLQRQMVGIRTRAEALARDPEWTARTMGSSVGARPPAEPEATEPDPILTTPASA